MIRRSRARRPRNRLRQQSAATPGKPSPPPFPPSSSSSSSSLPTSGAFFGVETSRSVSLLVCNARRSKEYTHTYTTHTHIPTHRYATDASTRTRHSLGHHGRSRVASLCANEDDYRQPRSLAQLLITRLASDVYPERKAGKKEGLKEEEDRPAEATP